MTYSNPQYLTTTRQLAEMLEKPPGNLLIFDITVSLVPNPPGYKAESGRSAYLKSHIPGAAFIDVIGELSDASSGLGFTLPGIAELQSAFRSAGINKSSQIVLYSSDHMMWASRVWWMLYSCGHSNVSVLDGGFSQWRDEGREVSDKTVMPNTPGDFTVRLDPERWSDKAAVVAAIDAEAVCTINALSPGVYSGEADMHYGRKGHIQNSQNVYYGEILKEGCFRDASELQKIFSDKGVLEKARVIAYCGGGISATIDALALALIGYKSVSVYDGSMSEWVRDESLALVLGAE